MRARKSPAVQLLCLALLFKISSPSTWPANPSTTVHSAAICKYWCTVMAPTLSSFTASNGGSEGGLVGLNPATKEAHNLELNLRQNHEGFECLLVLPYPNYCRGAPGHKGRVPSQSYLSHTLDFCRRERVQWLDPARGCFEGSEKEFQKTSAEEICYPSA